MKTKLWDSKEVCLAVIDYQDEMFAKITSSDVEEIERNIKYLTNAAMALHIPVVLSSVGVSAGVNKPTRPSILETMPGIEVIDRTNMNAWEDPHFRAAIKTTRKKKIIFCGLWTEICLAFPVVDALAEGFEVSFPMDAVGGMTPLAHKAAIQRMIQAGAVPTTTFALVTELFRDWKDERAQIIRPMIMNYYHEIQHMQSAGSGVNIQYS